MPVFPAHRVIHSQAPSVSSRGVVKITSYYHANRYSFSYYIPCSSKSYLSSQSKRKTSGIKDLQGLSSSKRAPTPLIVDKKQAVYNITRAIPSSLSCTSLNEDKGRQSTASKENFSLCDSESSSESKNDIKYAPSLKSLDERSIYLPEAPSGEIIGNNDYPNQLEKANNANNSQIIQLEPINTKVEQQTCSESRRESFTNPTPNNINSAKLDKKSEKSKESCAEEIKKTLKAISQSSSNVNNSEQLSRSKQENYSIMNSKNSKHQRPNQDAIERIKRNVEKKEEFLMRPNEPIQLTGYKEPKIYRDYHVSPQKLSPPQWPPTSRVLSIASTSRKAAATIDAAPRRTRGLSRSKSSGDNSVGISDIVSSPGSLANSYSSSDVIKGLGLSAPAYQNVNLPEMLSSNQLSGNIVARPYGMEIYDERNKAIKYNKSYTSTLSQIKENLPASNHDLQGYSNGSHTPSFTIAPSKPRPPIWIPSTAPFSSSSSPYLLTPAQTVPLAWVGDNERIKQLQIVSTRAKKFEETYRGNDPQRNLEYAKLSGVSKNVSVAQRIERFEKQESKQPQPSVQDSEPAFVYQTFDELKAYKGNRTLPVGSSKIHCDPPSSYKQTSFGYAESIDGAGRRDPYKRRADLGQAIYADSEGELGEERTIEPKGLTNEVTDDLEALPTFLTSCIACQGPLNVKYARCHGKKSHHRSWKSVFATLKDNDLFFYKDKRHQTQSPLHPDDQVTLRGASVGVATEYTKRKNVIHLSTPEGSQFLLQADSSPAMATWLTSLSASANSQEPDRGGKLLPLPGSDTNLALDGSPSQTPTSTINSSLALSLVTSNTSEAIKSISSTSDSLSDISVSKNAKKVSSPLRSKTFSELTHTSKLRKSIDGENNYFTKSKSWKERIGRHLPRKALTPPLSRMPEGASIGVNLKDCPPSAENEYIPLLVSLCVKMVEMKGLYCQGIYRIPGNIASVSYLGEIINRGPEAIDLTDIRWSDLNVISSLLKQFFQKIPDSLVTSELYPKFIEASRTEDQQQRLIRIKSLLQELPPHNYETLRFIVHHFNNVVAHSEHNKMTVANLATIFGPTLVRSGEENVTRMVTDMSQQCRIVMLLISQFNWLFNEESSEFPPIEKSDGPSTEIEQPASIEQLLGSVKKIENSHKEKNRLLTSILDAADRLQRNRHYRRTEEDFSLIPKTATTPLDSTCDNYQSPELPDPTPLNQRRVSSITTQSLVYPHTTLSSDLGILLANDRNGRIFTTESDPTNHLVGISSLSSLSASNVAHSMSSSSTAICNTVNSSLPVPSSVHDGNTLYPNSTSYVLSRSEPYHVGDDRPIRSYSELSEVTQERIRKFKQETAAMLQKDFKRHQREQDKRKLEEEWKKAKKDLETEDIFDQLADNPSRSDLLSVITATFEEKMRNLQKSSSSNTIDDINSNPESEIFSTKASSTCSRSNRANACRLYRDPSLHRRRESNSTSVSTSPFTSTPPSSQNPHSQSQGPSRGESIDVNTTTPSSLEILQKASDYLFNAEKTDIKERRARELKRAESQESHREKKPKELRYAAYLTPEEPLSQYFKGDYQNISDFKTRRQNKVKELKEKFESTSKPLIYSRNSQSGALNPTYNDPFIEKGLQRNSGKKSRKSSIKRRHTVGSMKDVNKAAWVKFIEAAYYNNFEDNPHHLQSGTPGGLPNLEQLQFFIQALNESKRLSSGECPSFNFFMNKEKLDYSSPQDLNSLLSSLYSQSSKKGSVKRHTSVREVKRKSLHPVAETNV